jgi:hypothetical protein
MSAVIIRHPRTGMEFEIEREDFRKAKDDSGKTYEQAGYKLVAFATGEPIEGKTLDIEHGERDGYKVERPRVAEAPRSEAKAKDEE